MIQWMLAIWSLVPLPFLNPAWTSRSSQLLKPSLEDFEHYFASMWNECNCVVVWTFFAIALLWDWNENWLFQSCGHYWVFQICWHIECSTLTASSFRIFNSSAGIPSSPLALFTACISTSFFSITEWYFIIWKYYILKHSSGSWWTFELFPLNGYCE